MSYKTVKSHWSNRIYPCCESSCDFVGSLDAFTFGACYSACPKCGGVRGCRTGRFVYELRPVRFIPFLKRKVFIDVEWKQ